MRAMRRLLATSTSICMLLASGLLVVIASASSSPTTSFPVKGIGDLGQPGQVEHYTISVFERQPPDGSIARGVDGQMLGPENFTLELWSLVQLPGDAGLPRFRSIRRAGNQLLVDQGHDGRTYWYHDARQRDVSLSIPKGPFPKDTPLAQQVAQGKWQRAGTK